MSSALVVPLLLVLMLAPGEAGEAACSAQQMQAGREIMMGELDKDAIVIVFTHTKMKIHII